MAKTATATDTATEAPETARTASPDQVERDAQRDGGPGAPHTNAKTIDAADKTVVADAFGETHSSDELLILTGRKFVSLEKDAYSKEKRSATVEADLVGLLAERIPVLAKLSLKIVAGWIQEARKGLHNHQATVTYLQDPTRATESVRVKPSGRDSYRQLAYRRMMLARIAAAVGGRLSPTGKPLFRKSEVAENVREGVTLSDGKVYHNPMEMLADGWSLRKCLVIWSDALHPKVKNLRDVPVVVTAEHIAAIVPAIKATVKESKIDKETGEAIETTKRVSVMSDPNMLADMILALLDRAVDYKFGPRIGPERIEKMQERLVTLLSQTPEPEPEPAAPKSN